MFSACHSKRRQSITFVDVLNIKENFMAFTKPLFSRHVENFVASQPQHNQPSDVRLKSFVRSCMTGRWWCEYKKKHYNWHPRSRPSNTLVWQHWWRWRWCLFLLLLERSYKVAARAIKRPNRLSISRHDTETCAVLILGHRPWMIIKQLFREASENKFHLQMPSRNIFSSINFCGSLIVVVDEKKIQTSRR